MRTQEKHLLAGRPIPRGLHVFDCISERTQKTCARRKTWCFFFRQTFFLGRARTHLEPSPGGDDHDFSPTLSIPMLTSPSPHNSPGLLRTVCDGGEGEGSPSPPPGMCMFAHLTPPPITCATQCRALAGGEGEATNDRGKNSCPQRIFPCVSQRKMTRLSGFSASGGLPFVFLKGK